MAYKIIGKSVLGELGFCQSVSKMGDHYNSQWKKVSNHLPFPGEIVITAITGSAEVEATKGEYFPKIRMLDENLYDMFYPSSIWEKCKYGIDQFAPGCDFIIWHPGFNDVIVTTFSREAPILAFESSSGFTALGTILRPSLLKYGDYLFSTIKAGISDQRDKTTVTLVTCNHFEYPEGSIPSLVQNLADKYDIKCIIGVDSEKDPECYHRGEKGNHVVAMW